MEIDQYDEVPTHLHLDDIAAVFILSRYCGHVIDIRKAALTFPGHVPRRTMSEWRTKRKLPVGCGGSIFDEHRNGDVARMENTCAAILAMNCSGLRCSAMRAIVGEINVWDNNIGSGKNWASILKMFGIYSPIRSEEAAVLTFKVLSAVHYREHYFRKYGEDLLPSESEIPFDNMVRELVTPEKCPDDDARKSIFKYLEVKSPQDLLIPEKRDRNIARSRPFSFFELRHIYESLWRLPSETSTEAKKNKIHGIVSTVIDLMYKEQTDYHSFRRLVVHEEFRDRLTVPLQRKNGEVMNLNVAVTRTDNSQAHAVFRSRKLNYHLSIVITTTGNFTILGNIEKAEQEGIMDELDEGIRSFVEMCRYKTLPPNVREKVDSSVLRSRGDCIVEGIDTRIHLSKRYWLSAYNGTYNHKVKPLGFGVALLRSIIDHAFTPGRRKKWKAENGVRESSMFRVIERPEPEDYVNGTVGTMLKDTEALFLQS